MTKTILVTDDSDSMLQFMSDILRDIMRFNVIIARNGEESISLYKKHKPDLVLMDINMPGMCGCEIANKIHEFDSHSKVIIVSVNDTPECKKAKSLYHVGFLQKPFEIESFKNKILKHITV